jgi:hypothetical protein
MAYVPAVCSPAIQTIDNQLLIRSILTKPLVIRARSILIVVPAIGVSRGPESTALVCEVDNTSRQATDPMAPIVLFFACVLGFIWLLVVFPSFRVAVAILLALGVGVYFLLTGERGEKQQNAGRNQTKQEGVELQAGVTTGPPMTFAEHNDGTMRIDGNSSWISADGVIAAETADAFEKFLQDALIFKRQAIVINSPGGTVLGAIRLGKVIREHQFLTTVAKTIPSGKCLDLDFRRVGNLKFYKSGDCVSLGQSHISISSLGPGECANACVFMLAGGVERYLQDGSRIGCRSGTVSLQELERTATYSTDMGIDPGIVNMMVSKTSSEVKWLSGPELASTKIIYDPKVFSDWTVEPYKAGLAAMTKSADGARQLTLFCSASRMRFKLTASGGVYAADFASSIGGVDEIEIAGKWIAKSNFNISDEKGDVVIVGDWVGTDTKSEDRATFILGLGVTGSERDLYSMAGFNGRGFDQSLKLARKNCVS